jgi:uncharacterized phage protein gp47/JayE
MILDLAQLIVRTTKDKFYETAILVAKNIGLPTDTWIAGDPTRSLYFILAEVLGTLEETVVAWIMSAFLDYATGPWLKIVAKQVFNVDVPEATFATTTVTMTNTLGGLYEYDPGDVTFRNSSTGKTFRNTTAGILAPGGTLSLEVIAEEPGADSTSQAGEIDEIVSGPAGVTCTNATAAIGTDEQSEATTRQQCRDKLGSLSPNGPAAAYAFVSRESKLTGTTGVSRVRVYDESETGDVYVYLAGPSGGVSGGDRTLVEAAIVQWANPLCNTPHVVAATNVVVAPTYEIWVYKSANKTEAEIETDVEAALETLFARHEIGGDIIPPATSGYLYKSLLESKIRAVSDQAFRVTVSSPASDVALANNEVAVLGAITATIHLVDDA